MLYYNIRAAAPETVVRRAGNGGTMNKIFNIKYITAVLVLLAVLLGAAAVYALPGDEEAEDLPEPEKKEMLVVGSTLNIYSDKTLTGKAVATRKKGVIVTASTYDGIIYTVYAGETMIGYCRASGLVYADTKTVVKLPTACEEVVCRDLITPDPIVNEEGETIQPEPVYGEEYTVLKHSELADVNEYAYAESSSLAIREDTVLVQRDILEALEHSSSSMKKAGLSFIIVSGYSLDGTDEIKDAPLSAKTGALIKIYCVDSSGASVSVAYNTYARSAIASAGLVMAGKDGNSDWYYASDYNQYLETNITSSDYVYVIYE